MSFMRGVIYKFGIQIQLLTLDMSIMVEVYFEGSTIVPIYLQVT